jgi:hypothetical protein
MKHDREYTETEQGTRWTVREYDALDTWLEATRKGEPDPRNAHRPQYSFKGWDASWIGCTIQEAKTMQNWPAGLKFYDELAAVELPDMPAPVCRKRKRRYDVAGDEFDQDRARLGITEAWETRKRRTTPGGNIITITTDLATGWQIEAKDMVWAGIATARLIDAMEAAGYRVEVKAVFCISNLATIGQYNAAEVITIKSAQDPMDIDSILLAIAHPAGFRYCGLAAMRRRPCKNTESTGSCHPVCEFLKGDIHINRCYSRDAAATLIGDSLAKYSENALAKTQA